MSGRDSEQEGGAGDQCAICRVGRSAESVARCGVTIGEGEMYKEGGREVYSSNGLG